MQRLAGRNPRRGKQAALAESCENIAKTLKNCAIWAVFWRRPPQALLVFKNKDCLCCAGLPRPKQAALADSSVFHKNYTRSLKRESISAQFFLSNSFRIIFRIRIDAQNEWWWLSLEREHFDKIKIRNFRNILRIRALMLTKSLVGTSNYSWRTRYFNFFLTSEDAFFD